jgi:thiamine pyrophosphate-dependent acetolactate synthase large subunit-like protein
MRSSLLPQNVASVDIILHSSSYRRVIMATRADIVRTTLAVARQARWPLIVGNGLLAREIMGLSPPDAASVLPLQGGMGLAVGVAAGLLLSEKCDGVIVLEGDGNHLMGWGGAQFVGYLGLALVHVVSCNGTYESTGRQPVPIPSADAKIAAAALNYAQGRSVDSVLALEEAMAAGVSTPAPTLIYVRQDPSSSVPPRQSQTSAEFADTLSSRLRLVDD